MSVDFDEYEKLESENVAVVTRQDLPDEFGDKAYEVIVEFIRKTRNLDYEWAIFFDYVTGEILRCVKGERDNVNVDFKEVEFEDYHVASIHNHPEDVYSPPSDRNFGILMREFEDYELIASVNELWILKAKGVYENLMFEIKFISSLLFRAAFDDSKLKYDDWDEINDKCDESYGNQLSKYMNDKNIRDIQLIKKEYTAMAVKSDNMQAEYNCLKRINDPEEFKKTEERIQNPNVITGKDAVYHNIARMPQPLQGGG